MRGFIETFFTSFGLSTKGKIVQVELHLTMTAVTSSNVRRMDGLLILSTVGSFGIASEEQVNILLAKMVCFSTLSTLAATGLSKLFAE